jgi:Ca2+-binding EF-hand superfamily protein
MSEKTKTVSEKKKSPDEIIEGVSIYQVEREALERVFSIFTSKSDNKDSLQGASRFGWKEVYQVLKELGCPMSKQDVQLMIWEVDEDLDTYVSKEEFETMFKRCVYDKTGLEPRKLFNLVQFMMFDKSNLKSITVEDTLELIFVRYGMEVLEDEIKALFGNDEKQPDGTEKRITFPQYLEQINQKNISQRKKKTARKGKN